MHSTNTPSIIRPETLSGIDAFRRLNSADRTTLAARCGHARYRTGQQILSCSDSCRNVYFIVAGRAQATVFSLSGRQVTLQDLGPGEMFGELSAIDGEPRSAHVVATADTLIVSLTPDEFSRALYGYPAVTEATLNRLIGMVRMLSERVFEISALPVRHRVHAELLRLALRAGGQGPGGASVAIDPAPTHSALASQVGTHREGVTREFNRLKRIGLISASRGCLIVHDVAALRALVKTAIG